MELGNNAVVAVVDGKNLKLFKNTGNGNTPKLTSLPAEDVSTDNKGSGGHHSSSSANPADHQQDEDAFAAGVAEMLNKKAMSGGIDHLVVIAAPRTLGELRKHYHKALEAKLTGEIAKDLTGHSVADIEKVIGVA
ncbi:MULTISPECIES: host attachment protein [unclassified Sphingomonas]|uniref:host attachment family protein n=1 Tax=unclassified Sphingomonas TaxID=196159 RepID=UPI00226A1B66|nr:MULTISPECIES: host attachment protein [unclassified Sphingomonas]